MPGFLARETPVNRATAQQGAHRAARSSLGPSRAKNQRRHQQWCLFHCVIRSDKTKRLHGVRPSCVNKKTASLKKELARCDWHRAEKISSKKFSCPSKGRPSSCSLLSLVSHQCLLPDPCAYWRGDLKRGGKVCRIVST